jgi:hypothetical protein
MPITIDGSGTITGASTLATTVASPTFTTPNINSAQFATVSGTAPIYPCRAWVNFNGTGTVAIRASGNVTSITDNNTGEYTVNFTTAMPDANYVWTASGNEDTNTGSGLNSSPTYKTITTYQIAASLRFLSYFNSRPSGTTYSNGVADMSLITVAIFR